MPAGVDDLGGEELEEGLSLAIGREGLFLGEGVKGVLNGWAAEVDVAAEGFVG